MNINQIFETLASNNSRNFKIDFLKQHQDNLILKQVVFLALDPFTQFYIRKIPTYVSNPADVDLWEAMQRLDLLSKRELTGNAAIEMLANLLSAVHPDDAEVIKRIIGKDLKCGVSESTVNKIWPNLIAEYPCMLTSAFDQKLIDKLTFPAYVQLKLDGMRMNAIVKAGTVEFRSRNGKEIHIPNEVFKLPFLYMAQGRNVVFDGELLVTDSSGGILDRQTGNGILNKCVKGTCTEQEALNIRATLWDMIPYEKFIEGKDETPYSNRLNLLKKVIFNFKEDLAHIGHYVSLVPTQSVENMGQAQKIFDAHLKAGQEGIIIKDMSSPWENKRSKKNVKMKAELECDLIITEIEEGNGKYAGQVGAYLAESADGIIKVSVGSGLKDNQREIDRSVIGKIMTVKYNARIKNKQGEESLFLPIFLEIREDKTEADSSMIIK